MAATGALTTPASNAALVSPDDGANIAAESRGLWVGGAGNMKVTMLDGTTLLISGIQAGTLLPIRVSRVWASTTTATLIVALY